MRSESRGVGALLTTETEHVDLGQHGDRRLRARVQRRLLRLGLGSRYGMSVGLGRLRPVAVEIREPDREYEVAIDVPPDPALRTLQRILLLWLIAMLISSLVGRGGRSRATLGANDEPSEG